MDVGDACVDISNGRGVVRFLLEKSLGGDGRVRRERLRLGRGLVFAGVAQMGAETRNEIQNHRYSSGDLGEETGAILSSPFVVRRFDTNSFPMGSEKQEPVPRLVRTGLANACGGEWEQEYARWKGGVGRKDGKNQFFSIDGLFFL